MQNKRREVTLASVQSATAQAKYWRDEYLRKSEECRTDVHKKERLEASLCPCCYYLHRTRIGGAAMTTQPCGLCSVEVTYSSTATDVLCLHCARAYKLCKRCGATIDLRAKRELTRQRSS